MINTRRIDWATQLLAGAVVTGTGCSFEAQVTGVRSSFEMVDVSVRAVQTGLCEKFGAIALWVILDDVPADHRVSFIVETATE